MKESIINFLPHDYALQLISNHESELLKKATDLQKNTNLTHIEALNEICQNECYLDYSVCKKQIDNLLKQASMIGKQQERIRCATIEAPELSSEYYLLEAKLELEHLSKNSTDVKFTPRYFSIFNEKLSDFYDEDLKIEIKIAEPVDPIRQIKIFREEHDKQLYIINRSEDLALWQSAWGGEALIRKELIEDHEFLYRILEPSSQFDGRQIGSVIHSEKSKTFADFLVMPL